MRIGGAMTSMGAPEPVYAIEAHGLTKRYRDAVAVDDLSFRVPRAGVTGFVGPNGSGKTTTMRMLLHLARASAGTARVLGESIDDPQAYLPRVGALIEAPAFYPQLSGRRNLEVLATLGRIDRSRIPPLLDRVGLGGRADSAYRSYSLGMKQRLGLAAALLPDPDLLLLDEPVNGLDPSGIREIRDLLRELGASGKAVLVSSHLIAEVARTCDHLIVIQRGKLVYEGPVQGLANDGDLEARILELTGRGSL